MKLPVIKHLLSFVEENDVDYLEETIETLESISEISSLKDEELDLIGARLCTSSLTHPRAPWHATKAALPDSPWAAATR